MKHKEALVQQVFIADDPSTFVTRPVPHIPIELAGILGDRHYGLLRPADSRQRIYARGTLIANRRQISIVSAEECAAIAEALGLQEVRAEWLGANLIVSGFEALTLLPQGARLLFPDGTGLICEGENLPCLGPGEVIAEKSGMPEAARRFVKAAKQRRGIVCSVEREGTVSAHDTMRIVLP